MQKPIKPLRPSNEPPSKVKKIETVLIEREGSLDVVPVEQEGKNNKYCGVFDKKVFEFISESIDQISASFPIEDFAIYQDLYGQINIVLYCVQSEDFYKKELFEFENRFENYKAAMLEYEDDLKVYEEWSRTERIKKLTEEATTKVNNFNGNKS